MNSISEALASSGFKTIDFVILVCYLILLVSLGLFLSRNKDGKEKSANDYFLAGNTLTWWAVGASLIAANISAEQFIGMSGTGFRDGIAIAAYEVMAAITLVVIGKFLLPVMLDRKIFTIPQFLRERYNDGVGLAFSILWLFLYVFVNLTSVAWLGALAIEQILGLQGTGCQHLRLRNQHPHAHHPRPVHRGWCLLHLWRSGFRGMDRRDAGDLPRGRWSYHGLRGSEGNGWHYGNRRLWCFRPGVS